MAERALPAGELESELLHEQPNDHLRAVMERRTLRVPRFASLDGLWKQVGEPVRGSVYLVPELPCSDALVPLARRLSEAGCRVVVAGLGASPRLAGVMGQLVSAGVVEWEATFPTPVPGRFAKATGPDEGLEDSLAALAAVSAKWGPGSAAPALLLSARVALDVRSVEAAGLLAELVDSLSRSTDRIALELWPRRQRSGQVVLPAFAAVAGLLARVADAFGKGYREGRASIGFASRSGLPLCLLHTWPDKLPWFRLHASEGVEAAGGELAEGCCDCALASWCGPAGTMLRPGEPLAAWLGAIRPFAELPESLRYLADREHAQEDLGRRLRVHVPGRQPLAFGEFERFHADAHLWGGGHGRRVAVERFPGAPSGTGEFPVLLARLPGFSLEERECAGVFPPLSLMQLCGALEAQGYPVHVVDLAARAMRRGLLVGDEDEARDAVIEWAADELVEAAGGVGEVRLLALSSESPSAARLAAAIAARAGVGPRTVLGGRGVHDGPSLVEPGVIDFVVEGEGEAALLALCRQLVQGRAPRTVPGLVHRVGGLTAALPSAWQEFDPVPGPSAEWVDWEDYPDARFPFVGQRVLPYLFVQGCPYHCAFCGDYSGGMMRTRDPALVVAHLAALKRCTGVGNFLFLNTLLNASPRYTDAFLDEMEGAGLGIRWCDSAKPRLLDGGRLERLAGVGCVALTWGIDAASPRLFQMLQKGFELAGATEMLRAAHGAGIVNVVNLIAGLPHEREADIDAVVEWLAQHRDCVSHVNVMPYRFMKHSLIYRFPERWDLKARPGRAGFDEVGGLSWEEKVEQIEASRQRINRAARELGYEFITTGSNF